MSAARAALLAMAASWLTGLLDPATLRLRRLVIAEAGRFPDVGKAWYEHGFDRTLVLLGGALTDLSETRPPASARTTPVEPRTTSPGWCCTSR